MYHANERGRICSWVTNEHCLAFAMSRVLRFYVGVLRLTISDHDKFDFEVLFPI